MLRSLAVLLRHAGQAAFAAGGRVEHVEAAAARHPLAVDQGVGLEQGCVAQQGKGRSLRVHGESWSLKEWDGWGRGLVQAGPDRHYRMSRLAPTSWP